MESTKLIGEIDACIEAIAVSEAPVAYFVTDHSTPDFDFVIRRYGDRYLWPVHSGKLTADRFIELAGAGDRRLVEALGAVERYGRLTLGQFESETDVRLFGPSSLDDTSARLQRGAARTVFCGDRVFFDAGPPAFFRPYHHPTMVVAPVGALFDCDGDLGFLRVLPGPPVHARPRIGATGTTIGIEEIDVEINRLPDHLYSPTRGQTVEVAIHDHPVGVAAEFCMHQFPRALREELENPYNFGPEKLKELLIADEKFARWWHQPDDPDSTPWLLERFACGEEDIFRYQFGIHADAARAILRRLGRSRPAPEISHLDETALDAIASMH